MRKLGLLFGISLILFGCSLGKGMDNTPTKQVEAFLSDYQTLNSNVLSELDSIVDQETMFDDDQKTEYRDILKKHYQDLTYTVKEETVNGDKATVEVEIEVNDYTKALKDAEEYKTSNQNVFSDDSGVFDESKYSDYRLKALKDNKDRVKYTIYFSLTKTNDKWTLDPLTDTEQNKILGIYEY